MPSSPTPILTMPSMLTCTALFMLKESCLGLGRKSRCAVCLSHLLEGLILLGKNCICLIFLTVLRTFLILSTAAWSACFLSPCSRKADCCGLVARLAFQHAANCVQDARDLSILAAHDCAYFGGSGWDKMAPCQATCLLRELLLR